MKNLTIIPDVLSYLPDDDNVAVFFSLILSVTFAPALIATLRWKGKINPNVQKEQIKLIY